jgi:ABC-type glutathione transport system ATPase component
VNGVGSQAPLLEVRDVCVEFPARGSAARAVDGVSLRMQSGQILALVGESGCGKTTLARTIAGLQLPTSGDVIVRGEPLRHDRRALREHRRSAQLIFQDPTAALNARQTIYEAVAEGVRIQKVPGDERVLVAEALSRAGLRPPERFFTLYPSEISGGQRQRVIIAGAMILNPSLLVADEPVSSLDASVRGEILSLMLGLARETRVGILVVTHDLGLAWNVADRVAVMYLGRIVEEGTTEEILTAPRRSCPSSPRSRRWSSRSSRARRPTRPASLRAAASTRAARCWPRARRRGSGSRSAAGARTR